MSKKQTALTPLPKDESFEQTYPHITWLVTNQGWIEMGQDGNSPSFVRALDPGGWVWEGESHYPSLESALAALDAGIVAWMDEQGFRLTE